MVTCDVTRGYYRQEITALEVSVTILVIWELREATGNLRMVEYYLDWNDNLVLVYSAREGAPSMRLSETERWMRVVRNSERYLTTHLHLSDIRKRQWRKRQ